MLGVRTLRVLLVATALGCCAGSARADGIYVCDTLTGSTCSHFTALTDGVATFESAGVTGDAIAEAVGWGVGVILLFFGIGLGLGSAHRALAMGLNGTESGG